MRVECVDIVDACIIFHQRMFSYNRDLFKQGVPLSEGVVSELGILYTGRFLFMIGVPLSGKVLFQLGVTFRWEVLCGLFVPSSGGVLFELGICTPQWFPSVVESGLTKGCTSQEGGEDVSVCETSIPFHVAEVYGWQCHEVPWCLAGRV